MPLRRSTCSDLPVCLQPLRCDFPLLDRQSGTEIGFPPRRPAAVHFLPPRTLGPGSKRNNICGCDLEPRKTSGQVGFLTLLLKSQKRIPRKVAALDHVPLSQSLLIAWTLRCFIVLDWERISAALRSRHSLVETFSARLLYPALQMKRKEVVHAVPGVQQNMCTGKIVKFAGIHHE